VETFLSKFIIVWVDKGFSDPEHKAEMDEYIDELNSYDFTKCKPFDTAQAGVKQLGLRSCQQTILISSGGICKWEKPKTLLELIAEKPGASKKVIDHIIYCGDEDAYKQT